MDGLSPESAKILNGFAQQAEILKRLHPEELPEVKQQPASDEKKKEVDELFAEQRRIIDELLEMQRKPTPEEAAAKIQEDLRLAKERQKSQGK